MTSRPLALLGVGGRGLPFSFHSILSADTLRAHSRTTSVPGRATVDSGWRANLKPGTSENNAFNLIYAKNVIKLRFCKKIKQLKEKMIFLKIILLGSKIKQGISFT